MPTKNSLSALVDSKSLSLALNFKCTVLLYLKDSTKTIDKSPEKSLGKGINFARQKTKNRV